jgi:hypothetical protein
MPADFCRRMEGHMSTHTRPTMKRTHTVLLLAVPLLAVCNAAATVPEPPVLAEASSALGAVTQSMTVTGHAVHYFTTAIVHSQEPTESGMIQRSTEIIELTGDLNGYILYHPTSTFDFANGTLVNTGTQFFSGTIAGSEPVVLHDDAFRFEVQLATGQTIGEVHLSRSQDAPDRGGWYECDLIVVGTGLTPAGDGMAEYSGECSRRGRPN